MSTDLKNTMKHNSSNHSIQTKKNMMATIRKPTDLIGLVAPSKIKQGSNYMSPYSQKIVPKNSNSQNTTLQ